MKNIFFVFLLSSLIFPVGAVTTRMFRVLDTCARYRLGELDGDEAIEKLKLKSLNSSTFNHKDVVNKYCSVFTPNEKIEY